MQGVSLGQLSLSDAEMKNLSNLIDESEAENTIKEFEPDLGY